MENLSILATVSGIILSLTVFTSVEIFALKWLKFGEPPKHIFYAILVNISSIFTVLLGIAFIFVFTGIGLIVAMDKGYNSGEKYITIAMLSITIIPFIIILVRSVLFYFFKFGSFLKACGYSLLATILNLILLSTVTLGLFNLVT